MATYLSQPAPLDLRGNVAENWKRFKQRFELYNVASGLSKKDEKTQTSMLLHVIGDKALDIYNTFTFAASGDEMRLEKVMEKFESYCMPKRNVTYERHKFFTRSQEVGENIDHYATELRNRAQSCEFGELTNSLIRDRIICGILDNGVRERLLRQDDLTLEKALQLCRAAETTRAQAHELSSTGERVSVDALGSKKQSFNSTSHKGPKQQSQKSKYACGRCGYRHSRNACPAQGQICKKCGRENHFAKCCRTPVAKVVNELQHMEEGNDGFVVDVVESADSPDEWMVNLVVNERPVDFKLDTGAQTNLLPDSVYQMLNQTKAAFS